VEPPLPDLSLLFGKYRGNLLVHLSQVLGDLRASIGPHLIESSHVLLYNRFDFSLLLRAEVQLTPQVGEQSLGGNIWGLWGSHQPVRSQG